MDVDSQLGLLVRFLDGGIQPSRYFFCEFTRAPMDSPLDTTDQRTVFLIDDDECSRDSISVLLKVLGWNPQSFEDGLLFIQWWMETGHEQYDAGCVILDYRLPGLDGLGVLRRFHELSIQLPVLLMTAELEESVHQEALDLGALTVLAKPTPHPELVSALEQATKTTTKVS